MRVCAGVAGEGRQYRSSEAAGRQEGREAGAEEALVSKCRCNSDTVNHSYTEHKGTC